MNVPWYELVSLIPLIGALLLWRPMETGRARFICIVFAGITFILALSLELLAVPANTTWIGLLFNQDLVHIDEFSRPLLPLTALIYFTTLLATVGHKAKNFSFSGALFGESLTLLTFSTDVLWLMVVLQCLSVIPIWFELRSRGRSTRVYAIHQVLFVFCLVLGGWLHTPNSVPSMSLSVSLLTIAVLIRSGAFPFHVWRIDLFEKATFGSAILFVSPMMGAYICLRWVLPSEPDWALHAISILSLATAVYAAGMALVQNDGRRFYCYLFLSHSSLVLVGLELATPIGIAGALSMWVSVGVALTSFGITMRCIEARIGRIDLGNYYGLYNHMPTMAAFFLLTGLASVGFPCTIGFVAGELLTESVIAYSPWIGCLVVLATTLNGIAVMRAYFRVFTGTKHVTSIPMRSQPEERFAIIVMTLIILGGGLYPQPGVESRYRAAVHLLENYHRTPHPSGHSDPQAQHSIPVDRSASEL
jgi:NADH-quinone oxidoreductase subunit M